MNDVARYKAKIDRSKQGGCHPWTAYRNVRGYGSFKVKGRTMPAHRFGWELLHGPIPRGMFVLHRCDNPPCQNPEHWFLGTNRDNVMDRARKGRSNRPYQRGQSNFNAKLSEEEVAEIRYRYTGERGQNKALAEEYDVHHTTISMITSRRNWA